VCCMCMCECAYVQLIRRELKNRELEDGKDFYNLLRMKDLLKCYWGESERAPQKCQVSSAGMYIHLYVCTVSALYHKSGAGM